MICNTSVLCAEILRGYIRKIPAPIPNHRPLPGATRPALVMDNYRVMRNYLQTWARKSPPVFSPTRSAEALWACPPVPECPLQSSKHTLLESKVTFPKIRELS